MTKKNTSSTRTKASSPQLAERGTRSGIWQLQEAKARLSELVRRARSEGPQHVTVHGRDEVVVISADEFRRLTGRRTGRDLVKAFEASPHRDIEIEPSRAGLELPGRDVDL